MSDFVILTDSSADLSADMVRDLGVQVLPLSFEMDEKIYHNYPDNREMDPHQFYELLRNGHTATTSAVNVAQYTELIEPLLQAGQDILILAFSSGLSTTFSSSAIAVDELREKYPERKVYTVDTCLLYTSPLSEASYGPGRPAFVVLLLRVRSRQQDKRPLRMKSDNKNTHLILLRWVFFIMVESFEGVTCSFRARLGHFLFRIRQGASAVHIQYNSS